jgi:hypothetical protein
MSPCELSEPQSQHAYPHVYGVIVMQAGLRL